MFAQTSRRERGQLGVTNSATSLFEILSGLYIIHILDYYQM